MDRKKLYQLIAIAKNSLGVDEDTHRDILADFGARQKQGRVSATTMTLAGLQAVLSHYESKGFVNTASQFSPRKKTVKDPDFPSNFATRPKLKFIHFMLLQLGQPWGYANAIVKKTTGCDRADWTSDYDISLTVKALRLACQRRGIKLGGVRG